MARTILQLSHVSKIYRMDDMEFRAISDISITVKEGEYVAIMGPSGSGKSTLMHIIGCLDLPTEGSVMLSGVDVVKAKEKELASIRNKYIGFVFQQFNLLRKTEAISNVELPLVYAGITMKERRLRALEILKEVGLESKIHNFPSQLSGGQQQRVAIARALITNPSLLLADEPTGNLDSKSGADILQIFDDLHAKGRTIVLVTHDLTVAKRAKRIIRITDGMVVKDA